MKEVRVTCDYCGAEIRDYIEVDAAGSSPVFISRNYEGDHIGRIVFANQRHYCGVHCFASDVDERLHESIIGVSTTPEDQAEPYPETDPHPEALPAEVPAVPEIIPVAPAPKEKPKAPSTMMVQAKRKPGQKVGVQDTYYHKNKFAAKLGYGGVADAFKHMEKKEFEKQFAAYRKEIN